MSNIKRRYTSTHKTKKRIERKRIEQIVIGERNFDGASTGRGKKRVYLTQEERQRVRELTDIEKKKRKDDKLNKASIKKKRQCTNNIRQGPVCVILNQLEGSVIST